MLQTSLNKNSTHSSLIDLLNSNAKKHPHKIAFKYLIGEEDEISLSYKQLVVDSKRIAAYLQKEGFSGKQALIMYPPGLEYVKAFLGCLYAGVIAVPVYPPTLSRNMDRIRSILVDASTNIIFTTSQLHSKIVKHFSEETASMDIKWICIDELILPQADQWKQPNVNGESIAFLQYTSGSTSQPKGVMVTHQNILYNEEMIKKAFDNNENTIVLGWLPLYHDMGLIGNVLQPLFLGGTSILMSPMDFLQKPLRWLQAISKYKATVSGAPNFAYELCVKKITDEQKTLIDLSSWKVAYNGAEPVRYETLKKFAEAFKNCGFKEESFYPCYGMAEATLFISGGESNKKPIIKHFDSQALRDNKVQETSESNKSTALVSCGTTYLEQDIKIVNPNTYHICSENEIGEIWVNGVNVAKGYFGTGDNASFSGLISNESADKYLKTGDLGFINNGQLYITGRLKDIIILRGKNYYPQDIELTTEKAHIGIRNGCSASFSITEENEEKLVIVAEVERAFRPRESSHQNEKSDANNVLIRIRQKVMEEHGVQPYCICLIKTGTIPKTSSGKIQRNACKQEFLNNELVIWHIDKKE
ncbi:fatty acyl-AMP ligase [Metabacillus sp. Hm71]|uniref:fatty acyl-AMP ligase n=1 Tax=Metabacillus sp. Hm71 TaxID=3450743 RepID=UPI003F42B842